MKWEYCQINFFSNEIHFEMLDEKGREGWEAYAVTSMRYDNGQIYTYYFKRQIR